MTRISVYYYLASYHCKSETPTDREIFKNLQNGIQNAESFPSVSDCATRVSRAARSGCCQKIIRFPIRPCFSLRFWCRPKEETQYIKQKVKHADRDIFKTVYKTPRASPRFWTVPREFLGQLGAVVGQKPSDCRSGHVSVSDFGVNRKKKRNKISCFTFGALLSFKVV